MADIAKLGIEVTASGLTKAKTQLKDLTTQSKKTETGTNSLTKSFSGLAVAAKAFIGAMAIREVAQLGSAFVKSASNAAETQNKFSVVFSSMRGEAEETAQVLADSYGMSEQAAKTSLSAVGDLLTGLGLQQGAALDLAAQTVQLGTDLASFTNYAGGAAGATEALTKAMLGETEQAKQLGLVLNEDQMVKFAASVGKVWKEMSLAEKAQLRLNAAMVQSPNAIDDFSRSSREMANQLRIVNAMAEDAQASLGYGLKGSVNEGLLALTGMRKEIGTLTDVMGGTLAIEIKSVVAGLTAVEEKSGSTGASADSLAESFVALYGGAKIVFNGFQLIIDSIVTVEDAFLSAGAQAIHLFSIFKNAATLDFDAAKQSLFDLQAVGDGFVSDMEGRFKETFADIEVGFTMTSDPAQFVKIAKEQQKRNKELSDMVAPAKVTVAGNFDTVVGTSTADKAAKKELAAAEKLANEKARLEKENNLAILASDFATAQQRIAIINSIYDSRVAAAERVGASVVGIEAERSLKIQAIWDKDKEKHGTVMEGFQSGLKSYAEEAQSAYQKAQTVGLTMARTLESGIGQMLDVTGKGFEDFGATATNVINDILNELVKLTITQPLTQGIMSGLGGGGGLLSMFGFAKGGVLSGGDISSYSGSIVSSPTHFAGNQNKAYAKGGNVMGEAGEEGIFPLGRTSSGELGVKTIGGGGGSGQTTVVINNYGEPASAETSIESDNRGGTILKMILTPLKQAIASDIATSGTQLNRASKMAVGVNNGGSPGMSQGF